MDNGSVDNTASIVAGYTPKRYDLRLVTELRRGVNSARNAGIRASRATSIFLCDADDVVSEGWLRHLSSALTDGVWVSGALSYTRLNSPGTRRVWATGDDPRTGSTRRNVDTGFGGNCGFTKSMWEQLSGFDERLSGDGDETEFFLRAWNAGFTLRWAPDAVVHQRLRPGFVRMVRRRYRQGRSQVRMESAVGGRLVHTLDAFQARRKVGRLLLASPKYLFGPRRYLWLSSMSRALGQLAELRAARRKPGSTR